MDVLSPIISPLSKPSCNPQNPEPSPGEVPSPFTFHFNALGSNGPSVPNVSSQSGRSRTGLAETGPEVKPFCSVSGAGSSIFNEFSYVFGAEPSGLDENLLLGLDANLYYAGTTFFEDKGYRGTEIETECWKVHNMGVVSDAGWSDLGLVLDLDLDLVLDLEPEVLECNTDKIGKGISEREIEYDVDGIDCTKVGNEAEGWKSSGIDFVFGSTWFNSSSNLNSAKNDSSGNMEKLVTEVGRKIKVDSETEFQKLKANEKRWSSNKDHDEFIFAFGSSVQEGSSLMDSKLANCQDEVKSSDKDLGGSNLKFQNEKCWSSNKDLDEFTFAFRSSVWKSSSLMDSKLANCQDEVQLSDEDLGDSKIDSNSQNDILSSDFSSTPDGFGVCFEDSNTPLQFPSCVRENLFPEINKSTFSVKGSSVRDNESRKTRGKSKGPSLNKQWPARDHVPKESNSKETPVSSECCTPMDFFPFEETTVADPHSRETSATSINSCCLDSNTGEVEFPNKESGSGAETPCFSSKNEYVKVSSVGKDTEDVRADIDVNVESQKMDCGTPCFASGFENMEGITFTCIASSSAEGSPIVANQYSPPSSTPLIFDAVGKSESHEQVHIPFTDATHETCEKWRLRGNNAYNNENFSEAESFYTQGIVSVPSSERSGSFLKPLLLCYSNRAAARKSMGRIREALGDCMMATALDPNFLKVQMRAANCHLLLGEVENALLYFNKLSESGTGVCLDRRIVIDSAEGKEKAQKVVEYTNRSAQLLEQRTTDAAFSALEIVSEALSISEYSEKLLKMKAEALCVLRRYEEVIQLCEQSLNFAERNFSSLNSVVNVDSAGCEDHPDTRLWRWFFLSKSYFHLGKLEAALDLLEKLEQVGSIKDRYASKNLQSSISLAVTIRELLRNKNAGNEAFRSERHTEAVDHYTNALSHNSGSWPFSAICLCKRAAAHQALGQITDAIADCSLAIALDGNYLKAVSRRATLHEMIRDYGQAASDLQRLISVLEDSSNSHTQELQNAYQRMLSIEEEAKKGIPINFYLILGIKPSDTSSNIRKAYRKAALKHHPDKASQVLARIESGNEERLWKEISLEVHKDADRLFKMIGEAYAVLSDPNKRSEYDLEEDLRKSANESMEEDSMYGKSSDVQSPTRSSHRRPDFDSSQFERSYYSRW